VTTVHRPPEPEPAFYRFQYINHQQEVYRTYEGDRAFIEDAVCGPLRNRLNALINEYLEHARHNAKVPCSSVAYSLEELLRDD
jgi:hypothetical protein